MDRWIDRLRDGARSRYVERGDPYGGFVAGLALMIGGGVAPTVVAGAIYWRLGHFDAWVFYNFTVNLVRTATDYPPLLLRLHSAGYDGWLVVEAEQDPAKAHPLTYARMGFTNLRRAAEAAGFALQ